MRQVIEGPDGPWRFTLLRPQMFALGDSPSRPFANDWIMVGRNGVITIAQGYAWDGCSVVPDGRRGSDGLPVTWRASLIHDALYQFCIDNGVYTRQQADAAFRERLRMDGFALAGVYYAGVRLFGGLFHAMGREGQHEPPAGS